MLAVSRIHLAVTSNSSVVYHHQEKVYIRKIDILREGIHGFGDYVQVYRNDAYNCSIERTRGAIVALSRRGTWTAAGTTLC